MRVVFERTGERRYAVRVHVPGQAAAHMDPAPGYDDHIPHDLVHYVVEAELGLSTGVFGSAARGGGTFISAAERDRSPRERARTQRKQRRRAASLRSADRAKEMLASERLAGLCDIAWRRRRGQRPDPSRTPPQPIAADAPEIERVLARLDAIAPAWNALPVGGTLTFEWPEVVPTIGAP